MKKRLAALLSIMLVMGLSCAAFAYDGEITFQDMPWYEPRTKSDIESSLNALDIEQTDTVWLREISKKGKLSAEEYNAKGKKIFGIARNVQPEKPIGGYENVSASMYYLIDGDQWGLFRVECLITVQNYDEAYADLKRKLESVYGEARIDKNGAEVSIWTGDNDTAITLVRPTEVYAFSLTYEKMDVKDRTKQAVKNYVEPTAPSNNIPDTTEGL